PRKGRYRRSPRIGAGLIGTAAPAADVEIVALFVDLFEAWGFRDLTVAINSVGTPQSRRAYGQRLRAWLEPVRHRLGADSQARLDSNPLRVLDTKDPAELDLLAGKGGDLGPMPRMLDSLDEGRRAHAAAVRPARDALGI